MNTYLMQDRPVCDFITWTGTLINYLKSKDVEFREDIPLIPEKMLVRPNSIPSSLTMLPSSKRSIAKEPSKCILCHFECDEILYRRVRSIVNAIRKGEAAVSIALAPYKKFFAVAGFDLTLTPGMDKCEQNMIFLLNRSLDTVFATNGIKIVPNFRIRHEAHAESLAMFPKGLCYAMGRMGEDPHASNLDELLTRFAILFARPGRILVYGYRKMPELPLFDEFGVPYDCFEDYRHASYERSKKGGL